MSEQQRTFPLLADVSAALAQVDPVAVANCSHWSDAMRLCVSESCVRRTDAQWAKALGLGSKGTFNSLLNSKSHKSRPKHLNPDLIPVIENLAGNEAITQYLEMRKRGQLFCQRRREITPQERIAQIEAEKAQLMEQIELEAS